MTELTEEIMQFTEPNKLHSKQKTHNIDMQVMLDSVISAAQNGERCKLQHCWKKYSSLNVVSAK